MEASVVLLALIYLTKLILGDFDPKNKKKTYVKRPKSTDEIIDLRNNRGDHPDHTAVDQSTSESRRNGERPSI